MYTLNSGLNQEIHRSGAVLGGFDKTGLVAWYDLDDSSGTGQNDSHDAGPYHLTENNSPTYNSGPPTYGISTEAADESWSQATLPTVWGRTTTLGNFSFVVRYRPRTGITSGNYIMNSGFKNAVRYVSSQTSVYIAGVLVNIPTASTLDAWNIVVANCDAGNSITAWLNNTDETTSSDVQSEITSALYLGASFGASSETDIDYSVFFNRLLTSDERTWFYNEGNTRSYAEA